MNLRAKLVAVMAAVDRIPKNGFNEHFKYHFARESDVKDTLRAELVKAKRALLVALTGRDYATAMVSYEQARIQRLSAYLNQPEVVESDAG